MFLSMFLNCMLPDANFQCFSAVSILALAFLSFQQKSLGVMANEIRLKWKQQEIEVASI